MTDDDHVAATESEDAAYKLLGNAKINLWDVPKESLTERERSRLRTILGKMDELEEIVAARLADEERGSGGGR